MFTKCGRRLLPVRDMILLCWHWAATDGRPWLTWPIMRIAYTYKSTAFTWYVFFLLLFIWTTYYKVTIISRLILFKSIGKFDPPICGAISVKMSAFLFSITHLRSSQTVPISYNVFKKNRISCEYTSTGNSILPTFTILRRFH